MLLNKARILKRTGVDLFEPFYLDEAPPAPSSLDGFPVVVDDLDTYPSRASDATVHESYRDIAEANIATISLVAEKKAKRARRVAKSSSVVGDSEDDVPAIPPLPPSPPEVPLPRDPIPPAPPLDSILEPPFKLSAKALGKRAVHDVDDENDEADIHKVLELQSDDSDDSETRRRRTERRAIDGDEASAALAARVFAASLNDEEDDLDVPMGDPGTNLGDDATPAVLPPMSPPPRPSPPLAPAPPPREPTAEEIRAAKRRISAAKGQATKARNKAAMEAKGEPSTSAVKRPRDSNAPGGAAGPTSPHANPAKKRKKVKASARSVASPDPTAGTIDPSLLEPSFST